MEKTITRPVIMTEMPEITVFLNEQIEKRGWSISEFARRMGVSQTLASDVLNGKVKGGPSAKFVIRAAEALDVDPVWLLRLADILPSERPSVQEEEEAIRLLRSLSPDRRSLILITLRGLAGAGPAPTDVTPEDRQRETIAIDNAEKNVIQWIYRTHNQEPPEGNQIEITVELTRLLLDQLQQVQGLLKPFWDAIHGDTSPARRDLLIEMIREEREGNR